MELDVTAPVQQLATAAADLVTLLPGRKLDPLLSGVVLTAEPDRVELAGIDRERAVRLSCPARTHTGGAVLVPARPLAEALRHLGGPEARLVVEGQKLAVRTDRTRFALPLLDRHAHPGVRPVPGRVGVLDTSLLPVAAATAAAASRDDALVVFTGVHLRADAGELVLVGTDRFRMAVARLPWRGEVDEWTALVPAALWAEIARQARGPGVALHADGDRFGASWESSEVSSAVLDVPFPSEARHLAEDFDGEARLRADELADAVRHTSPFAGQNAVRLEVGGGEVRVRSTDPGVGDAEETLKADTSGDRITTAYQPRYLADALKPFGTEEVRLRLRSGVRRSTVITTPRSPTLHQVLMPKRLAHDPRGQG